MQNLTPMMQQYLEIKEKVKDAILFFRLGDFYEMFFDDAIIASKELEIALTGRDCGLDERAPMCGVPYHSANTYISKLIEKGYKVAICEQVEDPKLAKGIVKREITRIITPGTFIDENQFDNKKNNYVCCIIKNNNFYGIAFCDISTGELLATEFYEDKSLLLNEIGKFNPKEILIDDQDVTNVEIIKSNYNIFIQKIGKVSINETEGIILELIKKEPYGLSITLKICLSTLLKYLHETQKISLDFINNISIYNIQSFMGIDINTKRNLELVENLTTHSKKHSLLDILDNAKTAMGSRLIRKWLEQPLVDVIEINKRLEAVEELYKNFGLLNSITELLSNIYDIERLCSKFAYLSINARDLNLLKKSIYNLPELKRLLKSCNSKLLKLIAEDLDTLEDIYQLIDNSIIEQPPISIKEGGIIKDGFNKDIDYLRNISTNSKQMLASYEEQEKAKTGIKNLKVGYNKVFGYYIEVTKSNLNLVPDTYIRKQTISNGERYITEDLKKIENDIVNADSKLIDLEYQIFCSIRDDINDNLERIQKTVKCISILDALCSFAEISIRNRYIKPNVNLLDRIYIKNGRHPVVEEMIGIENFIPNDTDIDEENNRVIIITGPNMAGKSTYMRQVALIVIMAQIGCFVPATEATIGIVDKIFSRIGASDNITYGQSTFMVEMSEVANILKNATHKSLIIFDEVGRGTSTYDGLSIAWSVVEYVANKYKIGAKTLFATHYHELTELEEKLNGVKNYRVEVKEEGKNIIFLRKIVRGGSDSSYGIHVARIAGIPEEVLERAEEILIKLEEADINRKDVTKKIKKEIKRELQDQIDLFNYKKEDIIEKIKSLDIMNLTPLQALYILSELKNQVLSINERI
ncbi:DNA mismatch repair protein MutS [Caldicellulosiruptoraceae bacterium PP1]